MAGLGGGRAGVFLLSMVYDDLGTLLGEADEPRLDRGLEKVSELGPGDHTGQLAVEGLTGDGSGDRDYLDEIGERPRHGRPADFVEDLGHLSFESIYHRGGELEYGLLDDEVVGATR